MNKHLTIDFVIMVLILLGLFSDGFHGSDLLFGAATFLWIYQPEIEKSIK